MLPDPHPESRSRLDTPLQTLDLILPCYNPQPGWAQTILGAIASLHTHLPDTDLRIILVNDGSQRGVLPEDIEALRKALPRFTYLESKVNRGKGNALRAGVEASREGICLFTDIDFPYTAESLLSLYQQLKADETDVAVGIKDASYYEHLSPFRVRISKFLRLMARLFLRLPITDTQCGLKGFNDKGKKIFLLTTIDRYLCDLEFIFLASRTPRLRMQATPVSLKEGVIFSQVNPRILLTEGINFLKIAAKSVI